MSVGAVDGAGDHQHGGDRDREQRRQRALSQPRAQRQHGEHGQRQRQPLDRVEGEGAGGLVEDHERRQRPDAQRQRAEVRAPAGGRRRPRARQGGQPEHGDPPGPAAEVVHGVGELPGGVRFDST